MCGDRNSNGEYKKAIYSRYNALREGTTQHTTTNIMANDSARLKLYIIIPKIERTHNMYKNQSLCVRPPLSLRAEDLP